MRATLNWRPARHATLSGALIVAASTLAFGAEETPVRNAIGVSLGVQDDTVRDDLLVPLTFSGPGIELAFSYRGRIGPGVLAARADFGFSFLLNRFGHQAATIDYSAEVGWAAPIWRGVASYVALGPIAVLQSRYNIIYSWDDAHAYWLSAEWLGLQMRYGARLPRGWRLESSLSFALVGFEGRPPAYRYKKQDAALRPGYIFGQPLKSQEAVTLVDLQAVRLDVAVRPSVYDGSDVGRGWSFGVNASVARTDLPAFNINLSACLYASYAWGW
jgi:hypothetical protein